MESYIPDDDDIPFEEEVLKSPYVVKTWWRYLQAKSTASPSTRNVLHERALRELPASYKLWYQYLLERRQQVRGKKITDPAFEAVNRVFERSLVFMHKMPRIWLDYLQFLMAQRLVTRTRHTFDNALRALPITQHDRIWKLYIKFVRQPNVPAETAVRVFKRYMKLEPNSAEDFVEYLVQSDRLDEAAGELARIVNMDKFESQKGRTRHQLWIQLCEMIATNPERIKSLPVEKVIRQGIGKFTEMVGRLWTALADYYIRRAHFEKARDVYEEAVASVATVRDFSVVFDAYSQFEESMISAKMAQLEKAAAKDADTIGTDLDLRLARLDKLMDRRPFLLNSVLLRQNPHNVHEWLKRARLYAAVGDDDKVVETYSKAVNTVQAEIAVGRPHSLWIQFARFYEMQNDMERARIVLEKGSQYAFRTVDDLATLWCEWAEMELRQKNIEKAVTVLETATRIPPPRKQREDPGKVQMRLYRSTKLWCFLADLQESRGNLPAARAAYDQMIDLKISTARSILNYAFLLEQHKYFEDAFRVYERGVALFTFPAVMEIWAVYLTKFVRRYGGRKLERARDLFEQALEKAPPAEAKTLFLLYARLEEEHGLARRAMDIYARAVKVVVDEAKPEMYAIYLSRAAEFFGAIATREIHEQAIHSLPDRYVPAACVRYASLETKLGEIERSRAIFGHGAKFADPARFTDFWAAWHDLEVRQGNEDTFREMLRVKRTVQTSMGGASFAAQLDAMKQAEADSAAAAMQAASTSAPVIGKRIREDETDMDALERLELENAGQHIGFVAGGGIGGGEGDEIDLDAPVQLETLPIPTAVFGAAADLVEGEPVGAMARLKRAKK